MVSPGLVMTSPHLKTWQEEEEEEEADLRNLPIDKLLTDKAKKHPSRRISTKKDIAEAIYFFLNGVSNITGQNLVVDDGFSQVY